EIGILSEIIADCEKLTNKAGLIPPPLEVDATRYRLESTIVDIFCRQTAPTILLLDDLHWGMDGVGILHRLTQRLKELPLMVVASYRNEESPHLPVHLPLMERIHLKRLTGEEIKELSVAMLGEGGSNPALQELLIRETDGNTFFVVEVVRALAENAGPLGMFANSQSLTIPRSLSVARIESVLRRRLRHVPYWGRDLLNLTAVLGRVIDVLELQTAKMHLHYVPNETLESWFTACSAVNVLDIQDNVWQFAHDKLRETLLENLNGAEHRRFNRDAAIILEQAHPDHPEYLPRIVQHWRASGDAVGEVTHSILCADYMLHKRADYHQSITLIRRTLDLLENLPPNDEVDYHLYHEHATLILAESYVRLNEYNQARITLQELDPLLRVESNHTAELLVLRGIIEQHLDHDLATAEQDFLHAITIFEENGLVHRAAEVYAIDLSDLYLQGQQFQRAINAMQTGANQLTLSDPNNRLEEISQRLGELLHTHGNEPVNLRSTAELRTVQSLEDIGTPFRGALSNLNRGIRLHKERNYVEATALLNLARNHFQELGHPFGTVISYHHLVRTLLSQEKRREAQQHALNMAHMASARTESHIQAYAVLTLAYLALFDEDFSKAVSLAQSIMLSNVNITSLRTQTFEVLEEARIRLVEDDYSVALQSAQQTTLLEVLFTWRWSQASYD
ncbi:MAG: ATP-binding protein, partial [Phototrophicaceae bacterium]